MGDEPAGLDGEDRDLAGLFAGFFLGLAGTRRHDLDRHERLALREASGLIARLIGRPDLAEAAAAADAGDDDRALLLSGYLLGFSHTDRHDLSPHERAMHRAAANLLALSAGRPDLLVGGPVDGPRGDPDAASDN